MDSYYQIVSCKIQFAHATMRACSRGAYEKASETCVQCASVRPFFRYATCDRNFACFEVKKAQFWTFLVKKTTFYAFPWSLIDT